MKEQYVNDSNKWVVVSDLFNQQKVEFNGTEEEANKFYNKNVSDGEPTDYNNLFMFAPNTGLNFKNEWKKITLGGNK